MAGPIDLHIHSCYSDDGEYSPSEIVHMCSDHGINLFAIADHNTVRGVEESITVANKLKKKCYPAIEIDCTFHDVDFHVLGYDIAYESTDFEAIEQNIRRQTMHASKERLRLVNRLGFDVREDEVRALAEKSFWPESWTGEMIAEVLLNNEKYHRNTLLQPYINGERSDNPYVNFYWDYCSQGKPCYVKMMYPNMKDVIELIHRNQGRAILAHPGINLDGKMELLDEIIPLGIDGFEAYSSYHDQTTAAWFVNRAVHHGLMVTRGSDFHGKTKPSVHLGCTEKERNTAM